MSKRSVRRLCFDTESNYFKRGDTGVGDPDAHREFFRQRGEKFAFHCAVVYDSRSGKFREFRREKAEALVTLLGSADELVSHSGRRVDLLVLEHACGEDRIAPLWRLRHHDLFDIFDWQSLNALAKRFVPDRLVAWELAYERRVSRAERRWPTKNDWASNELFIAQKLAKARFDVEKTWGVFEAYVRQKMQASCS